MKNKDFIVVGLQPWDIEIGSNCKNIALELSKNNRVLYVNRALDRISLLKNKADKKNERRLASVRGKRPEIEKINDRLWVLDPRVIVESVNKLPDIFFDFFNKRNNRLIAKEITKATSKLRFEKPNLLIDNDFFRSLYLAEMLDIDFSVYYIRDFLSDQPYFKKHGARCERALMAKSDFVIANSALLSDYAYRFNKTSTDIGQGCDFTLFHVHKDRLRPSDLPTGMPIVGYVGAIVSYRLDEKLLLECASQSPELNWVFVGPEDDTFRISKLHALENVFFLGAKAETLLADYISYFDVCINPQLVNQNTSANYPRKIDEYLSLGKPVVATRTDFMKTFEDYVSLCSGAEQYLNAIRLSIGDVDEKLKHKRRQFALSHTWENSVDKLYQLLNNGTKK
jgi:teichuronic acid biosynthesis glycosyltransferase TuaH